MSLEATAKSVLIKHFGIQPISLKSMAGYESVNLRVKSEEGATYVLKIYKDTLENRRTVAAEDKLLQFLEEKLPGNFPVPVLAQSRSQSQSETQTQAQAQSAKYADSKAGRTEVLASAYVEADGSFYRLLTFLEGTFMAECDYSKAFIAELGGFLGKLDRTMLEFDHHSFLGKDIDWDLANFERNARFLGEIPAAADRKLVQHFLLQYRENVSPVAYRLRCSMIHNDANDWNVLFATADGVAQPKVCGLIDFGDSVVSATIYELAVALSYAMLGKSDPLKWAAAMITGYHRELQLEDVEISLLYYLVAGRLCTSVLNSAHAKKLKPDNDYIAVSERPAWELLKKWISINPLAAENAFRIAAGLEPAIAADPDELREKRLLHLSPVLSMSYKRPIHMTGAIFQYMYAGDGTSFLDAYNNIPHVGHSHPRVVEAGQRQMARLNTNTRYLYNQLGDYAERLLDKFPASLDRVFFVNSGSAASDLAMRLASAYTGRYGALVVEHGYHGNTRLGIDISHYKFGGKGGGGAADNVRICPLPDVYRGQHGDDGAAYAREALTCLEGFEAAAFIAEPVVGCGGQVPLAPGYLEKLYPALRSAGVLCISDEVQTGFGRLGNVFWGYEQQQVVPDIVVLGKPIANGHPMAAVVTRSEIAAAFDNGMEFFSSFGGNPVSCSIANAVLEVIDEEGLQQAAEATGTYFMGQLQQLKEEFPQIGDVRGSGLFIGVDFVKAGGKEQDTELAQYLKNGLREQAILVSTDGPKDNVIKMKPPLCFSQENAQQVVAAMKALLEDRF